MSKESHATAEELATTVVDAAKEESAQVELERNYVSDGDEEEEEEEEEEVVSVYELSSSGEDESESDDESSYEEDLAEMVDFEAFGGDEVDPLPQSPSQRVLNEREEATAKARAASSAAAVKAQREVEAAIAAAEAAGKAVSEAESRQKAAPIPLKLSRDPIPLDRSAVLTGSRRGSVARALSPHPLSPPPLSPPPPLLSPKQCSDKDMAKKPNEKDKETDSGEEKKAEKSSRKEKPKGRSREKEKDTSRSRDREKSTGSTIIERDSSDATISTEIERKKETKKRLKEKDRSSDRLSEKERNNDKSKSSNARKTNSSDKGSSKGNESSRGRYRKKSKSITENDDQEAQSGDAVVLRASPSQTRVQLRSKRTKVASTNTMMLDFRDEFLELLREPAELCLFKDFVALKPKQAMLLQFWSECERYLVLEDCTDAVASGTVALKICETYGKEELLPSSLRRCLRAGGKSKRPKEAQNIVKDCAEGAFEALLSQSYPNFRLTALSGRIRNRRASINVGINLTDPFEAPDCPENIKLEGSLIVAATVPKLIQRLTADINDPDFTYVFLLTYRYVLRSSYELLSLLTKRFNFVSLQGGPDCTQRKTRIMLRTVNVIKLWVDGHRATFLSDEKLQLAVRAFAEELVEPTLPAAAKNLNDYLTSKLSGDEEELEELQFNQKPPKPKKPKGLKPGAPLTFEHVKPLEFARQISILDYKLFRAIRAPELLQQSWTRQDSKYEKAPNVLAMIEQFNRLGYWVITEVVTKRDPERRTKTLMKLIRVGYECFKLGNLNGAMAIFSSLKNSNISRLRKTWSSMSSAAWDEWEELDATFRVDDNFAALRAHMSTQVPPTIPYLGLYLSDLTFVDSDETYLREDDTLVNFAKLRRIATLIGSIAKQQLTPFNLEALPMVQDFLRSLSSLDEDEFYEESLACEQRRTGFNSPAVASRRSSAVSRSSTDGSSIGAGSTDLEGRTLRKRASSPSISRKLLAKVENTTSPPSSPSRRRKREPNHSLPPGLHNKRRLSFLIGHSNKRNGPSRSSSLSHVQDG